MDNRWTLKRRESITALGTALVSLTAGCSGTDSEDNQPDDSSSVPTNGERSADGSLTPEERDTDDSSSEDEQQRPLEIADTVRERQLLGRFDSIVLTVAVHNPASSAQTCWVGFSVTDITGAVYDHEETTHRQITVPPADTASIDVEWAVEEGASTGTYDASVALWERETDDGMAGEIDRHRYPQAFVVTEARPNGSSIRGDAVYVWREAQAAVEGGDSTDEFIENLEQRGISHVFLSWGALPESARARDSQELEALVRRCSDIGTGISLLWGEAFGTEGVERLRDDFEAMDAVGIDSVHIDLEPDPETDTALESFLAEYDELLDAVGGETEISVFMAPFWFEAEAEYARQIRDHENVSWVILAAYRNTESDCRRVLQRALVGEPANPYVAAFEFQSPTSPVVDTSITFWDQEADHAMEVMGAIARDPPTSELFKGVGLHDYGAITDEHYG